MARQSYAIVNKGRRRDNRCPILIYMHQKYILTKDGEIRFGRVDLHRDLYKSDINNIASGGWWHVDNEKKTMLLYGGSTDFGIPMVEDLQKAWCPRPSLNGYTWLHSYRMKLSEAIADATPINIETH